MRLLQAGLAAARTARLGALASPARALSSVTYRSTRGGQAGLRFDEAVLQGLATDKGLLVPEAIPSFPPGAPEKWRGLSFEELAYEIMSIYIQPSDVPADALRDIIKRSYATFRDPAVTPIRQLGGVSIDAGGQNAVAGGQGLHVLELFHGPTFAFKDVALQFLGNLFEHLLQRESGRSPSVEEIREITVVGATSGDTGSSAIQGLRGKAGVQCFIMYPEGRTSRTQELQVRGKLSPSPTPSPSTTASLQRPPTSYHLLPTSLRSRYPLLCSTPADDHGA